MNLIRCKNYDEMSVAAAEVIEKEMAKKPSLVLGLATGSTPEGMYKKLCDDYKAGKIDFSKATTVNLDEYCGISADHEQSYLTFMKKNLFDKVNLCADQTHLPCGTAADLEAEAERYEDMVAELGYADVQVLGVGRNGHIGFNEPSDVLLSRTHVTALTKDTIEANSRFFASEAEVPTRALTMGVGTIMKARHILLLASGASKRAAITALLSGGVDTNCPVTLLQLHPNVTVICDEEACPAN